MICATEFDVPIRTPDCLLPGKTSKAFEKNPASSPNTTFPQTGEANALTRTACFRSSSDEIFLQRFTIGAAFGSDYRPPPHAHPLLGAHVKEGLLGKQSEMKKMR